MAWVESRSPSLTCRHSASCTDDVARWLADLERLRGSLRERFGHVPEEYTFVLHDGPRSLLAARPVLGALWRACEPACRPYVTGWVGDSEAHLLSPPALRARSAGVPGAERALDHAAATLLTRRVIMASNRDLHRALAPARTAVALRWAWLLEGASRYFSGESRAARPAVVARLRAGGGPEFPPSARTASLLAGTVFELLVAEAGERRAVELATRLHPDGATGALVRAFGGRPLVHTEGAWRSYLSRLASG